MPSVEQGEVLVKVRYCGVCGSDLHIFQNIGHVPSGGVMGHEISGLVTEIGSGVEKVRPGDRVTARGVITGRRKENGSTRADVAVWMEKEDGTVVIVGAASALE